jgi:hypothetical protein
MIRLRSGIERALGHRWLGPLIILALAVLLVFVVLHTAMDAAHDDIGLTCVAIAVLTFLILRVRRQVIRVGMPTPFESRGPPLRLRLIAVHLVLQALPPPLRL